MDYAREGRTGRMSWSLFYCCEETPWLQHLLGREMFHSGGSPFQSVIMEGSTGVCKQTPCWKRSWEVYIWVNRRQEAEATGPGLSFWNHKDHPSDTVSPARPHLPQQGRVFYSYSLMTKHSAIWAYGGHRKHQVAVLSDCG